MPEPAPLPPLPWRYQIWERRKARLLIPAAAVLGLFCAMGLLFGVGIHYSGQVSAEVPAAFLLAAVAAGLGAFFLGRHGYRLYRSEAKALVKEVAWSGPPSPLWFGANSYYGRALVPLPDTEGRLAPMPPVVSLSASCHTKRYLLAFCVFVMLTMSIPLTYPAFPLAALYPSHFHGALVLLFLAAGVASLVGFCEDAADYLNPPTPYADGGRSLYALGLMFLPAALMPRTLLFPYVVLFFAAPALEFSLALRERKRAVAASPETSPLPSFFYALFALGAACLLAAIAYFSGCLPAGWVGAVGGGISALALAQGLASAPSGRYADGRLGFAAAKTVNTWLLPLATLPLLAILPEPWQVPFLGLAGLAFLTALASQVLSRRLAKAEGEGV